VARRDYYEVLGVSRTATQDEIKRSFRGLALQWHPDRNPDDPDAERRFRDIADAWRVLSDPEERARYDRLGALYRADGKPPSPDELNAFVADALAGLFGRKRKGEPGDDLKYTLALTLEEAGLGAEKVVELRRRTPCTRCEASGAEPGVGRTPCPNCEGSGKSSTRRFFRGDCPRCDGRGFIVTEKCKRCSGAGVRDDVEQLKVRVPAGVATGQKLKLRGKGSYPRLSGPPGDLLVLLTVDDHPLFRRRGADLFVEVPVRIDEAALGTELAVPTLDGLTRIRVPAGTPSGKVFRLAGRGLRQAKGRPGDLHVKVQIEVPHPLTPPQRQAVVALADTLAADAYPDRAQYEAALSARAADDTPNP
jgi:molecular chaperone DnaJ